MIRQISRDRAAYLRIEMDRETQLDIRMVFHNAVERAADRLKRSAEALAPVRRDEHESPARSHLGGQARWRRLLGGEIQSIDDRIAGDKHIGAGDSFIQECALTL